VESRRPVLLPAVAARPVGSPRGPDPESLEIMAAIELVASGRARRVVLSGLPEADLLAPEALAAAQGAGVGFALSRDPETGVPAIVVGPRRA
jgi:hypothetical protein